MCNEYFVANFVLSLIVKTILKIKKYFMKLLTRDECLAFYSRCICLSFHTVVFHDKYLWSKR